MDRDEKWNERKKESDTHTYIHNSQIIPTGPFTTLDLRDQSQHVPELNKLPRS